MPPADVRDRVTVYLDAALKAEVDRDAERRGQSLTTWLERACKQRLGVAVPDAVEVRL